MTTLDDRIAQGLLEAHRSGELQSARTWGKPLELDEGGVRLPEALRMAFNALKAAGFVPPEIETMRQINALRAMIRTDPLAPDAERRRRRLSELQQHLALRLEQLRKTAPS